MRLGVIVADAGTPTTVTGAVGGDQSWIDAVTAGGHEAVLFSHGDTGILTSDCVGFIVTGSVVGNLLPGGLKDDPRPVVVGAGRSSQCPGIVPFALFTTFQNFSTNIWTPQATGHALLPGLTSGVNFAPWVGSATYKTSPDPVAGITALAYVNAVSTRNAYFLVPAGSTLADGTTVITFPRIYIAHDGLAALSAEYAAVQAALVDWLEDEAGQPPDQEPPVVSATIGGSPAQTGGAFTLTGSATVGPADPPVTAQGWTAVTAGAPPPVSGTVAETTAPVTTQDPGDYTYRFSATNTVGTSTADVTATVLPVDEPEWPLLWRKPDETWGTWDLFYRTADLTWINVGTGLTVPSPLSPEPVDDHAYPGSPIAYPSRFYPGA